LLRNAELVKAGWTRSSSCLDTPTLDLSPQRCRWQHRSRARKAVDRL